MAKKKVVDLPLLAMLGMETPTESPIKVKVPKATRQAPARQQESVLVIFKGGKEVSHWNCENDDVEQNVKSEERRGCRVEVYPQEVYYQKMRNNEFQMSHKNWGVPLYLLDSNGDLKK